MGSEENKPQIPSRASERRRHVFPAGIRGFPLPKGNRDADERRFVASNPVHLIGSWYLELFLFLRFSYVYASGTIRRVGEYGFGVIIFQKP